MVQSNLKVSVIIPVYNTEKYLRECLDSVVNQTLKDIEIICVDDGSTDSSLEILQEYKTKDNRIKVLTQPNSGSGPARNNGIMSATGEYVAFMDADDYYPDNAILSKLYLAAIEHKAVICGGSFSSLLTDGTIRTEYDSKMYWGYVFHKNGEIQYEDYQFDYGYHRFIYERELLIQNSILFPPYLRFQDPPFFVKAMITARSFFAISDITYRYRKSTAAGSITSNKLKVRDSIYGYTDVLNLAKENNLQKLYRLSIDRCCKENRQVIQAAENIPDPEIQEALRKFDAAIDYSYRHEGISYYTLHRNSEMPRKTHEKGDGIPKVSVIMPSLNVAPYICECMETVVNQTLEDIEIICVDGGSTDGTLEVLEEYATRDQRITIIHSDKKSYGYQMNRGIAAATGEYIGVVETDDYIEPEMYEKLYEIAIQYSLDLVKADFRRFTDHDGSRAFTQGKIAEIGQYNKIVDPSATQAFFLSGKTIYTWAGIYNTQFLRRFNILHNETPGASYQDNGFWFQVFSQAKRAMFIENSLYNLRRDNPNSSYFSTEKLYCACEEYDFIRNFLSKSNDLEDRFASVCAYRRMCNYDFTLKRISRENKLTFLERYAEDFRKLLAKGELDRSLYTAKQWTRLSDIMESPEYVFYRYYYKPNARSENSLSEELNAIKSSKSYRIGSAITFFPRKIRGGIRCYKEHGAGHTFRRMLYHIGLWKDEKTAK